MCPASLKQPIEAEPLPPAGIDILTLPPALAAFWFGDFLPWARDKAVRLEQGRKWCAEQEAARPGAPPP